VNYQRIVVELKGMVMSPLRILVALALVAVVAPVARAQAPLSAEERAKLQAALRSMERWFVQDLRDAPHGPDFPGYPAVNGVILLVKRLPEGDELRRQAIDLARRHARVKDMIQAKEVKNAHHHQVRERLHFAWKLLSATNILRIGMSLEDAVVILGPPTSADGTHASWFYQSSMHFNPGLSAELIDGHIGRMILSP
jgi:hypothetical protein